MCAAVEACKLAVYLKKCLAELRLPVNGPVQCFGDNTAMLKIAGKTHPSRKCRHWRTRADWVQSLVDCGIVSFHYISSINNISDVNTKIQPKFTWDGLSRLLVGASPKFIPGTNINVRFAKQLAQQERAEEKSRARDLRTESEGRSANESIEAKPARQSRQRTNDTSHRDTCSQKQRGSYTISKN